MTTLFDTAESESAYERPFDGDVIAQAFIEADIPEASSESVQGRIVEESSDAQAPHPGRA